MSLEPVLSELAAFVASAAVPEGPQHAARRTIANAACLMVGSANADAVRIAAGIVDQTGMPPSATILGRRSSAAIPWAAFVMGIAAHVEDFDDTHLRTIIHPGAPVPPAALAVAEWLDRDTIDLAEAVAVGVEVMLRIGNGMSPDHGERGWHMTATFGHIGAAAVCARLLGLDARRTAHAVRLALVQAGGIQAVLGTMAKSFHPGRAAMDGCEAALLARHGWRCSEVSLEGPDGYAAGHCTDPDFEEITVQLGSVWELEANAFKPYACGIVAHPLIDAGLELRRRVEDATSIASIEVDANPWVLIAMGLEEPQHGLQSKFSAYHAMAAGILYGRAGPQEFSDEVVLDPALVDLRRRIVITADDHIERDAAVVRATDVDGGRHDIRIDHATGSVERPMSDDQLRAKGRRELLRTLEAPQAGELLDVLFDRRAHPVRDLVRLATPR